MSLTKQQLLDLNNSSFPNNNAGAITAEDLRVYNSSSIAAFVDENTYLVDSASFTTRINYLYIDTSSFVSTASFNAYSQSVNTFTASISTSVGLLQTFSGSQYKTDSASFSTRINQATNEGQFVTTSSFNAYTSSNDAKWNTLESQSGSWVTAAITASSLVTASFSSQSLTFTKGDGSQFSLTIPDISGSTINTASFATTGSNTFNGNQIISGSEYISNGDLYLSTPGAGIKLYSSGSQSSQIQWYLGDQTSNRWLNIQRVPGGSQVAISDFPANNHFMFFQFSTGSVSQSVQFEVPIQSTGSSNLIINNGVTIAGVDFIPFSSSVDSRINTNTTNIATLTSKTGSYATTGSNQFSGSQNITGSLTASADILVNSMTVGRGGGNLAPNIAFGSASLQSNTTGISNIGIGVAALQRNTTGNSNTAIGGGVLTWYNIAGAGGNTAIGAGTLGILGSGSTGTINQLSQNTAIGSSAATALVTGARNTIIGAFSFQTANNIERNTGVGRGTLNTLGSTAAGSGSKYNTAIGHNAAFGVTSGSNNVIIHGGAAAGEGFVSGSSNILLGTDSGLPATMESNTIIGRSIAGLTTPLSNNVILADGSGNIALQKNSSSGVLRVPNGLETSGSLTIQSGSTNDLYMYGHKMFNYGAFQTNVTNSGSAGVSQSINFEITDTANGVSIVSNSRITFANAGVYSTTFSAQIECNSGADTAWIWLKKNGTNVAESATKVVMPNNTAQTMTVNFVNELNAGDYLELAWQNNGGNAKILAENASGNIPAIPAVIVTSVQVR